MSAEPEVVSFRVADPGRELAGVRLVTDVPLAGARPGFSYRAGHWELALARPPVSRMEYLLELRHAGGGSQTVPDPANPRQAPGAFGVKSVREFAGYEAPSWLSAGAGPGSSNVWEVTTSELCASIGVRVWSPADAPDDEPLPLLIAHDGPEFDALADLTGYLAAGVAGRWLPRLRAALLGPGDRDRWYSANSGYARALRQAVIPAITARVATKARVGMGASLGALAMLHAHCRYPDAFDALFLQSGSFFTQRLDGHERRFPYYQRITAFVAGVHQGKLPQRPIPVILTCGVIEENLANNRLMTATLARSGYDASLREVPDMHNYTAWRDALDPHLTALFGQVSQ